MQHHHADVVPFDDAPESVFARLDHLLATKSPDETSQIAVARAAYDLWLRGYCVVPPAEDGSKAPIRKGAKWDHYRTERSTAEEMYRWYIVEQRTGIGVVLDSVQNLHCLEWEGRAVEQGLFDACIEGFERDGLTDVWHTLSAYMERTPKGGVHVYYRLPESVAKQVVVAGRDGEGNRQVFVEDLGHGGYVIVGPSFGKVHPSGRAYVPTTSPTEPEDMESFFDYVLRWSWGDGLTFQAPLMSKTDLELIFASIQRTAEAAGIVTPHRVEDPVPAVIPFEQYRRSRQGKAKQSVTYWFDLLKADPNVAEIVLGLLVEEGWQEARRVGGVIQVSKPGASDPRDVHGTIGANGPGVFHCFSLVDPIFGDTGRNGMGRSYSPGQVLALVRHQGSYRAAADDIARYYGQGAR